MSGASNELTGQTPCTECGLRMALRDWSFAFGMRSRGVKLSTGVPDRHVQGSREVRACLQCERSVKLARFRMMMSAEFSNVIAMLLMALFFVIDFGGSLPRIQQYGFKLAVSCGMALVWLGFHWWRVDPKVIRAGFFERHRSALAAQHRLKDELVSIYHDVTPGTAPDPGPAAERVASW